MKKSLLPITATCILLPALILGACSNNDAVNETGPAATATASTPVIEATASPEPTHTPEETGAQASASPEGNGGQSSASPEGSGTQTGNRPATQSFDALEGGVPAQTGTLTQGDGYSLYVFDGFTLDAAASRLSLTEDPAYYAEIEPLPSGYDLAALKQQGQEELSAAGTPQDYSGELIEHPMRYAELYLQVSGAEGLTDYMVWKNQAGDAYLIRIYNPKVEPSSEFAPWLTVSLSTIEGE